MTKNLMICITILCGVSAVRQRFESMARLAFEHGVRINELATCDVPKPQLIYFKDPNKVYLPRATLIHRCSDLTGCCPHSTQTCAALETRTVDLYFYTVSLKSSVNSRKVQQFQNIDKITMTNHTRCGCVSQAEVVSHNTISDSVGAVSPDYYTLNINPNGDNNFSNSLPNISNKK